MTDKIEFKRRDYIEGQILTADDMDRIDMHLEDIYNILYAKPALINYSNIMYTAKN
jgi:hypothetical protein